MNIAVACDHGAFDFKKLLVEHLKELGHHVEDFGTDTTDSCDYPDFGVPAASSVQGKKNERAILACTNGIGMSMLANKLEGVRAAMVYNQRTAEMTRLHHDSNVLCLGAQEFDASDLVSFVDTWLTTEFEGGRHQRRVDKFPSVP